MLCPRAGCSATGWSGATASWTGAFTTITERSPGDRGNDLEVGELGHPSDPRRPSIRGGVKATIAPAIRMSVVFFRGGRKRPAGAILAMPGVRKGARIGVSSRQARRWRSIRDEPDECGPGRCLTSLAGNLFHRGSAPPPPDAGSSVNESGERVRSAPRSTRRSPLVRGVVEPLERAGAVGEPRDRRDRCGRASTRRGCTAACPCRR